MPVTPAVATLLGSGISAAASAGGNVTTAFTNKANRKWQTREREASQRFQMAEADRAYDRARKFMDWEQSNYTSPAATMRRLKEAGLNPDLAYGGISGGVGNPFGSTPSAPSAPSPHTLGYDVSGYSKAGDQLIQGKLAESQAKLNDSNANKANADARVSDKQIEVFDSQIKFTDAQTDWTKEDRQRISKQMTVLDQTYQNMTAEYDKIKADTAFQKSAKDLNEQQLREMKDTFKIRLDSLKVSYRDLKAKTDIDESQAQWYADTLGYRVFESFAKAKQGSLDNAVTQFQVDVNDYLKKHSAGADSKRNFQIMADMTIAMMTHNAGLLEKQLDLLRTYGEAHEIVNMVTQTLNSISQGIQSIKGTKAMPWNFMDAAPSPIRRTVTGFGQ